jgi:2-oxoglutarate dehydrogenase complex dehydrogenase (E1) component-like enzyme
MGGWRFVREQFLDGNVEGVDPARLLRYVGRPELASPAPGSHGAFQIEQDALVLEVMRVGAREKATA